MRIGEEYSLECLADGVPRPKIKWIGPNGRSIDSEVLDLSKEMRHNPIGASVQYECVAENGINDPLRKTITVSYNVPAKIQQEKYSNIQMRRGQRSSLNCSVVGDLPINVRWSKDNSRLERFAGHHYDLEEIPTGNGILAQLHIRSVTKSDSGVFRCEVDNEHGRDERTIKMVVVEEPAAPTPIKVNEVWSRSASISWRSISGGVLPVQRYIVHYWRKQNAPHRLHEIDVSPGQTNILIKDLRPGLSYEVGVAAENEVGRSEMSETVTFHTGEEEPTAAPSDISVEPRGPSTVRVSWRAPPHEFWNGPIKGYYIGYRREGDPGAYTLKSLNSKHPESRDHTEMISNHGAQYEYFLSDLQRVVRYEVIVKAYNLAGSGPSSQPKIVATLDGDMPLVQYLTVTDTTPTSFTLRWQQKDQSIPQQSQSIAFTVHWQKNGDRKWTDIPLSSMTTQAPPTLDGQLPSYSYTINNLETGAHYRIFVTASNIYGFSDPSNILSLRTTGEPKLALAGSSPVSGYYPQNPGYDPYYLSPGFTIPILAAFVIVFIAGVSAFVCVKRAKHRAQAAASRKF